MEKRRKPIEKNIEKHNGYQRIIGPSQRGYHGKHPKVRLAEAAAAACAIVRLEASDEKDGMLAALESTASAEGEQSPQKVQFAESLVERLTDEIQQPSANKD